jgi:hypothetical protein
VEELTVVDVVWLTPLLPPGSEPVPLLDALVRMLPQAAADANVSATKGAANNGVQRCIGLQERRPVNPVDESTALLVKRDAVVSLQEPLPPRSELGANADAGPG